jgi:hypothetical protein
MTTAKRSFTAPDIAISLGEPRAGCSKRSMLKSRLVIGGKVVACARPERGIAMASSVMLMTTVIRLGDIARSFPSARHKQAA